MIKSTPFGVVWVLTVSFVLSHDCSEVRIEEARYTTHFFTIGFLRKLMRVVF